MISMESITKNLHVTLSLCNRVKVAQSHNRNAFKPRHVILFFALQLIELRGYSSRGIRWEYLIQRDQAAIDMPNVAKPNCRTIFPHRKRAASSSGDSRQARVAEERERRMQELKRAHSVDFRNDGRNSFRASARSFLFPAPLRSGERRAETMVESIRKEEAEIVSLQLFRAVRAI